MNSTDLLNQFRLDCYDGEAPYLWSDEEVIGYIDDAQRMFCRLVGGIGDASSPFTRIAYTPASDWVALSPLILKIRDACDLPTGREIDVWNFEDMRRRGIRFNNVPGRVRHIITGIEEHRVRLYSFPADAGTIQLMVDRLPLKAITDTDQKLEIDEQHHRNLLLWVSHLAYSKQDAETFDRTRAAESETAFRQYCFDAKAERERLHGKVRTVAYGGL